MFPENKQVLEREEVVLGVKAIGIPQPKMTWHHNEEDVVADNSHELTEDGSPIVPSTELTHSEIYQPEVINDMGSVKEDHEYTNLATYQSPFSPIPVEEFGYYVCKYHANDNEDFKDQFTVR